LPEGTTRIKQQGKEGKKTEVIRMFTVEGKEVSRELISTKTEEPVSEIIDIRQIDLMAENMRAGSFLSSKSIISPNDPRFFTSSLDPNQEVAYRVYIKAEDSYILHTISGGDYIAVYNQQIAGDSRNTYDRKDLVKVSGKVLVLQAKTFSASTDEKTPEAEKAADGIPNNQEYAGYVALKVTAEQAKKFYSLDRESKLVILPAESNTQDIDSRGVFIRKLRGQ